MRRLLLLMGFFPVMYLIVAAVKERALEERDDYFEMSKQLEIMQSAFRELNMFYVDDLAPGELMETGISAMLADLDPYTRYYPESKIEDVRFIQTGEYGGVGATIESRNGETVIMDLLEGEPADRAGIQRGDVIKRVDGRDIAGLDQDQIGELLQGASGTKVAVELMRPGRQASLSITIERKKVKVPDVPYVGMLSDRTGYLSLSSFTSTASSEVRKAVINLTDSLGAKNVVIDLRGNGGGLLREAIAMVNLFVEKGTEVVSTKGKIPDWNKSYKTRANPIRPDLPIAILVDGQSASASEIVAGTLQDLDRAIVVGEESFGKGLVQQTKTLAYGARLKVTVAKYYTPSGRCVQRLDYSHRDDQGEVHAMADSSLKIFYTKNGRSVLEGRGVLPDIQVGHTDANYVLEGLMKNGVLFDFAVQHKYELDVPEDAATFTITSSTWDQFVDFVEAIPEVPYASNTFQAFELLEQTAEGELLREENSAALEQLRQGLQANVRDELRRHHDEVSEALELELISHLYNTTGEFRHGLAQDPVAIRAVEALESGEYIRVLSGPLSED